jgi:acetyl esterase/lipase
MTTRTLQAFGTSLVRLSWALALGLVLGLSLGCNTQPAIDPESVTLAEERKLHITNVPAGKPTAKQSPTNPPKGVFRGIRYESPAGKLAAYVSPDPKNGKKNPAIVWIGGGDYHSIGSSAWTEGTSKKETSASAFRRAGIVMMFPSLRGAHDNPGIKEGFYGEVDDVIAAGEYLRTLSYVDPQRVYLAGHSSGATLALLVAETTDRFRAVFAFGPMDSPVNYPAELVPFPKFDAQEVRLRTPEHWLHCITVPTFVFEGSGGNVGPLFKLQRASKNPKVNFYEIKNTDHFSVLAPVNTLIAQKILADTSPECLIEFALVELNKP